MQTDMTQTCALTNLLEEYSPTHCIRFKNNTMMRAKSATFCRKIKKGDKQHSRHSSRKTTLKYRLPKNSNLKI